MADSNAAAANQPSRPTAGEKAPVFSLDTGNGNSISLDTFRGKKLVLYFYPKDDTPGCTIEAKDFRDYMQDFANAGAIIVGVSKDSMGSHDKFREKYCLPFTLGSDESGRVCEDYGVWVEKSMYGKKYMGIDRVTFLIDEEGVIRQVWNKVKVDGHVKEVLEAVRAL